jgi:hypothetical protein
VDSYCSSKGCLFNHVPWTSVVLVLESAMVLELSYSSLSMKIIPMPAVMLDQQVKSGIIPHVVNSQSTNYEYENSLPSADGPFLPPTPNPNPQILLTNSSMGICLYLNIWVCLQPHHPLLTFTYFKISGYVSKSPTDTCLSQQTCQTLP